MTRSRLTSDLLALAEFGQSDHGVTRLAWSDELFSAYGWLSSRAEHIGLSSRTDAAGNLDLRWQSSQAQRVVVGSHLDTVPHGGRFDGALGVLGGLEAVRILQHERFEPRFPISVVAFMDEEGTRFGTALFGSRAFVGDDVSSFGERKDHTGMTLAEAMEVSGYSIEEVPGANAVSQVDAYLELHIEQGPALDDKGVDIGIVTSIVGLLNLGVRLSGEANHAGTTPMSRRRDALVGAARVIEQLRDLARATPGMTANVGTISVEPGGKNVIPGVCEFTIDVRAPTSDEFAKLDEEVRAVLTRVAREEDLIPEVSELYRLDPVPMDIGLVDLIVRAADSSGASHLRLPSGAGHDAMALGRHVASGMIFVPSRDGISHSPAEHTSPAHCDLGAAVLARTIEFLHGKP